jgi:hypothetical protein
VKYAYYLVVLAKEVVVLQGYRARLKLEVLWNRYECGKSQSDGNLKAKSPMLIMRDQKQLEIWNISTIGVAW